MPFFPAAWHNKDRCLKRYASAEPASEELRAWLQQVIHCKSALIDAPRDAQCWFGDFAAWWMAVLTNTVREGWIHPRGPAAAGAKKYLSHNSLEVLSECCPIAEALPPSAKDMIYRWLQPSAPRPQARMLYNDSLMSAAETHRAWGQHLQDQYSFITDLDPDRVASMHKLVSQFVRQSRSRRGQGPYDTPYDCEMVTAVIGKWRPSQACPADLCPRAAFKCKHAGWLVVVSLMQLLCGPGILAYRPVLWRLSTLLALFKSGNPRLQKSYRLIFVKVQLGLLQESLVAMRLKPVIFSHIHQCQSGFARGI